MSTVVLKEKRVSRQQFLVWQQQLASSQTQNGDIWQMVWMLLVLLSFLYTRPTGLSGGPDFSYQLRSWETLLYGNLWKDFCTMVCADQSLGSNWSRDTAPRGLPSSFSYYGLRSFVRSSSSSFASTQTRTKAATTRPEYDAAGAEHY